MNYRHAYHAGNHGDVLKHAVMTALIERLHDKPTPVVIVDTHAGIGSYDLAGIEAGKTEEWRDGVDKILTANPPALASYIALLRRQNPGDAEIARYPGSPAIAAALMRSGDRLILSELHPQDAETLRRWARGKTGVAVHSRDGYEMLKAVLPPPEGRGLIVVDPPYEAPDEYRIMADAVINGCRRWPGGRWLIWHPVKDRTPVWHLQDALMKGGVERLLSVESLVRPADGVALAGSGLLLINPPYGIEAWLEEALPQMVAALAPRMGSHSVRWLGPV